MTAVIVATARPRPADRELVRAAFVEAAAAVHTEDGCELYALHDGPDGFGMIEK